MRLTINMSAEHVPQQSHCKEGSWQVWRVRTDLHVALCEKHGKAQLADAPKRTADETYGQILGRNRPESGAGYKRWTHEARLCLSVRRHDSRVAYSGRCQIVKFGYNKAEIRSVSVSTTSPSGWYDRH